MNQSKATTERHQRALLELLKQPGNNVCADCHARNPRWASWSLGVFLCVQCAGIHRKMGVHVSKVKSVTLDSWTKDQLDRMKAVGNVRSNAAYIPDEVAHPPPTDLEEGDRGSQLERFIRQKYERRAFVGPSSSTPSAPVAMIRRPASAASSPSTSTASVLSASPGRPGPFDLSRPPPVPPKTVPVPFQASPSPTSTPALTSSTGAPSLPSHLQGYQHPRSASLPTPTSSVATNPFYRSQGSQPTPQPAPPPPPAPRTDGVWGDLLSLTSSSSPAPALAPVSQPSPFSSTPMAHALTLPPSYSPHPPFVQTPSPQHPFFPTAGHTLTANPFMRPHAHSFSTPVASPLGHPTNPFLAPHYQQQHHHQQQQQQYVVGHQPYPVQYGAHQQPSPYPYATM